MIIKVPEVITLMELLQREFTGASRNTLKKRITQKRVSVNGQQITNPTHQVLPGDTVVYTKPGKSGSRYSPPFHIIYEDGFLFIVEKPAGILTVGDRGTPGTSVYKQMLDYVRDTSRGKNSVFVIHRLDREVSGLLMLAKSEQVQQQIKANWKNTRKKYYALVHGHPHGDAGTLRSWLKESKNRMVVSVKAPEGAKLAITHYRVLKNLGETTFLEIELETGRKNQIRVQLADAGCPVVGDFRYGAQNRFHRRIRLHAYYLKTEHPVTHQVMEFHSSLPADFLVLKEKDEHYR